MDALELIAGDRTTFLVGVGISALGWLLFASMLWLSFYAVGVVVPFSVPLLVVPLATATNFVPVPGDVGSLDAALVLLLVVTGGIPAPAATAAVIVHRSASVLLPVVVGGTSAAVLRRDRGGPPRGA